MKLDKQTSLKHDKRTVISSKGNSSRFSDADIVLYIHCDWHWQTDATRRRLANQLVRQYTVTTVKGQV